MTGKPLIGLLLIVATFGVFWQVRSHDFLNYDDDVYVSENSQVQEGFTRESVIWAFTSGYASNWHPLTWLSHMLDCQLFGLNPGGHHLTNLMLHLANTLLLFLLLNRMTSALYRSALVAALFALHPLHVESVAWVAERKDVLSTLFWMLTMWTYLLYVEHPRLGRYLFTLVVFTIGLMAKPMLVTLPCVLLLLDYWPLDRLALRQPEDLISSGSQKGLSSSPQRSFPLRLFWEKVPFFVLAAVSSAVTFLVQQSSGALKSVEVFPLSIRIANGLVSYVSYIYKMIWPQHLAVFYPHPGSSLPMWLAGAAGLLLLGISVAVMRAGRRHPYLAVGWLWYLGTLVPVIGLVQVGLQAMADRYTYVPLIGLFIMIAWGIPELTRGWRYGRVVLRMAAGSLLAALMVCTWMQLRHWRNNVTLFEHALNTTTNNYLAHDSLGNTLAQQGKTGEAIGHYSAALRIKPNFVNSHNNLGLALLLRGDVEQAIAHFSAVLRYQSDSPEAHNNLGLAMARQGYVDRAIDQYFTAVRLKPDYPQAHNNLGNALASQGRFDQAISHYSEALRIKPENAEAHSNLANVLASKGRFKEAIDHYSQALQIKPDNFEAHNNLGVVLADQGKFDEAIEHYYEALRIEPNNTIAHIQLALVWLSQQRTDKAIEHYQKALSFSPDSTVVLNNLAWILATHENSSFRDGARAVQLAEKACTLSGYKNAIFLDTLAAAYAEAGRFHEALQTAQKASKLSVAEGRVELAKEIERRMQLYKAGKPFYES
ncbi:MAG: tetratricopeptide repeat protein [Deltaproteobacteria bacterium]|nr:MAG: tetratricopeptide repeat protein [Deltaproteobacteria bacterium]